MQCRTNQAKLCGIESCQICWSRSVASHPMAKNWSSKNTVSPWSVHLGTQRKYYFIIGDIDILKSILHIVRMERRKLQPCNSKQKVLCGKKECEICISRSFYMHPMAKNWSSKNLQNPWGVRIRSAKKYFFICKDCGHDNIEMSLDAIVNNTKNRNLKKICRFCVKSGSILCDNDNCSYCFLRSFASHPKSKDWSNENKLTPRQIHRSSMKVCLFNCNDCGHKNTPYCLNNIIGNTIHKERNNSKCKTYCGFCNGDLLCNSNCEFCYKNSFASVDKSEFWAWDNPCYPSQVRKYAATKYNFDCPDCGNKFLTYLSHIACGKWCPICKNKTEKKLYNWLKENYNNVNKEKTFDWCKNTETQKCFRFDFYLKNENIIIELDGDQHFKKVECFKHSYDQLERDIFKMKLAQEHGISIVRIYQMDVYYDKNNWQEQLKNSVKEYNNPCVIYIGEVYEKHRKHMK